MKKTAFITIVTGQDGSHLTEILLEKGYEVHGLVRKSGTFNIRRIDHIAENEKFNNSFSLHYGDLTDPFRNVNMALYQ